MPSVPDALHGYFPGVPSGSYEALPQRVRNGPSVLSKGLTWIKGH